MVSKLTDDQIFSLCAKGLQEPLIEPFNEFHLTPNGYDLTIGEIEVGKSLTLLDDKTLVFIPPKTFFCVMTLERINLNKELVAQLWLRSSFARRGIMATFGFIDAGFKGKLALSLYNSSEDPIKLGAYPICQIVFEDFLTPKKSYDGKYQNQMSLKV